MLLPDRALQSSESHGLLHTHPANSLEEMSDSWCQYLHDRTRHVFVVIERTPLVGDKPISLEFA